MTEQPWHRYWKLQSLNNRQHDLISSSITVLILCSNMFRSTSASSSYSQDSLHDLRLTQCVFAVAILVHVVSIWLLLQRPDTALQWRTALTCARWLTVSGIVSASTPLPVFQASNDAYSNDAYSTRWLALLVGCLFRSGAMFIFFQALFYRLPWRMFAVMSVINILSSSWVTGRYCGDVMATFDSSSSSTSQQQHVDLDTLQGIAAALDTLSGQGCLLTRGSSLVDAAASMLGPSAAAAAAGVEVEVGVGLGTHPGVALLEPGEEQWQPTARALAAACSQQQAAPALQEACRRALTGQCVAVVSTMKVGVSYLFVLLMVALEHYSKWQFVRYQQQQQAADRVGPTGSVEQAGSITSTGSSRWRRDGQPGSLMDPTKAPTAGALLRLELLKLLVLGDVPVLLLWWGLCSVLRSQRSVPLV